MDSLYLINKNCMKKFNKSILYLLLSGFLFAGCNSLLDVDSDRIVFEDQYNFKGANDTLYSMSAILGQVQKLANGYVLLGELRGDLMDAGSTSSAHLREINDFAISATNPYVNPTKDYYAIINNCNYVIHNIDTSIVKGGIKVLQKEYAAAKGIRAWTYMQLALNYGNAIYYEKPIMSIADAEAVQAQPAISFNELAPLLIADLSPWKDTDLPNFGSIYSLESRQCFFPIRFLLGDLYLWLGQYENAANEYHDLMYNGYKRINNYKTMFTVAGSPKKVFTGSLTFWNGGWDWLLTSNSQETMTYLAATNQYGRKFELDSLCYNHAVAPSSVAINNWNSQIYIDSIGRDTIGDLRRIGSLSQTRKGYWASKIPFTTDHYIMKYALLNPLDSTKNEDKRIILYRNSLLYLRYAEAVNRLGKPNLAFAVLKYGLNSTTMAINKYVPLSEKMPLPNYMDFRDIRFTSNIGIRMRGCGNVNIDTTYFRIPNYALKAGPKNIPRQDSIEFVEDAIQKELALETAFEGNRFHDLMRIAIRRNDPAYLADLVAAKHTGNKSVIREKLMNKDNWYLKKH
jgi:starch-binding outer membrane protein, SusD/RagB family